MKPLTSNEQLLLVTVGSHHKGDEITGAKIANSIGLKQRSTGKEGADLRSLINSVRRKGYPVCANGRGYYWPKNQDEIMDYQQSLQERIHRMQEAYDGIEHALEVSQRQPPLGMIEQLHKDVREV